MNGRPEYHTGLLLMTSSLLGVWPHHPFHVLESHSACFSAVTPVAYFEVNLADSSRLKYTSCEMWLQLASFWPSIGTVHVSFNEGIKYIHILQVNTLSEHTFLNSRSFFKQAVIVCYGFDAYTAVLLVFQSFVDYTVWGPLSVLQVQNMILRYGVFIAGQNLNSNWSDQSWDDDKIAGFLVN